MMQQTGFIIVHWALRRRPFFRFHLPRSLRRGGHSSELECHSRLPEARLLERPPREECGAMVVMVLIVLNEHWLIVLVAVIVLHARSRVVLKMYSRVVLKVHSLIVLMMHSPIVLMVHLPIAHPPTHSPPAPMQASAAPSTPVAASTPLPPSPAPRRNSSSDPPPHSPLPRESLP